MAQCVLRILERTRPLIYGQVPVSLWTRNVCYIQGQEPEKGVREYFYFIDHQGMLFLDDSKMKNFTSCFKDKKFLAFFFRRIKRNTTGRYEEEFPFWSDCGKERNYIRGDDFPIVYTHIIQKSVGKEAKMEEHLSYGRVDDKLTVPFEPSQVYMADSGRIYHPAPEQAGSVGLISSKLAIELSKYLKFESGADQGPSHLEWKGKVYELNSEWYHKAIENV